MCRLSMKASVPSIYGVLKQSEIFMFIEKFYNKIIYEFEASQNGFFFSNLKVQNIKIVVVSEFVQLRNQCKI